MTLSINSKRTPPPPHQRTFNRRLKFAALLSAVFATAALILTSCPSPAGTTTYTTTVTGTVTASEPGESSSIHLPGARISALTTPANPANQPAAAGPDGRFTLQVKHSGSFRLKVENACSEPFTTAAVSASADGSHNAGAISLTLKSEPTGTDRYSITQKSPGNYKLTVNCVRAIGNNEFGADGTIITAAAAEKGVANRTEMITEIALPSTLRRIGERGFGNHTRISGTLTIPRNVETLARGAFRYLGSGSTSPPAVVFETGSKLTRISPHGFSRSQLKDFTFPVNLETIGSSAFSAAVFSFSADFSSSGTLIIPSKVSNIGVQAFMRVIGITAVDIRSKELAKPDGAAAADFPLQPNLFQNVTGITEIKLPQTVYDSYTKAELQAVFGSSFTNYRKPDGTAYDFAGKS